MKALDHIKVVDLTRVLAGPYATMVLTDLGAEVIKVESLNGDEARGFGPFKKGISGYFQSINRGKKSIAIDLKHPDGREILLDLLKEADVLIENFRPGAMKRLNLDYESLKPLYPKLIYAACSGFGQNGPYSDRGAYDMIIQGMGGIVSVTGEPGSPPVRVGVSIGDLSASLFTTIGIMSALLMRHQTGAGQMVDVSMLDCQVALLENAIARYDMTGQIPEPLGSRHPSITPFQAFKTEDGWIMLALGNNSLWQKFCNAVDRPDLVTDNRFKENADRTENHDQLEPILSDILINQSTDAWIQDFLCLDIPCGPIQNVAHLFEDPQIQARNMLLNILHPIAGTLQMPGSPVKLSASESEINLPAPDLGEHTLEILKETLGYSAQKIDKLRNNQIINS